VIRPLADWSRICLMFNSSDLVNVSIREANRPALRICYESGNYGRPLRWLASAGVEKLFILRMRPLYLSCYDPF
jgi:hypothetical protein